MSNLIPALTFIIVTTFTPGPNNTMSLVSGKSNGYIKSLRFLTGIFTGFFFIMLLCALSNRFLFKGFPSIKPYLSIVGSVYMLYLAYKIMRSNFGSRSNSISSNLFTYWKGFLLQFMNVKVILYGLVLYGTFISPYFNDYPILFFTAFIFASTSFISISLWALIGSKLKKIINQRPFIFNIVTASLMAFSSVSILYPIIIKFLKI